MGKGDQFEPAKWYFCQFIAIANLGGRGGKREAVKQ